MKKKRITDKKLLAKLKELPCVICGKSPSDPCHIKSVGSGGDDVSDNLLSMCRVHHTEQHTIGFFKLSQKYPKLVNILASKGWKFDDNKLRKM